MPGLVHGRRAAASNLSHLTEDLFVHVNIPLWYRIYRIYRIRACYNRCLVVKLGRRGRPRDNRSSAGRGALPHCLKRSSPATVPLGHGVYALAVLFCFGGYVYISENLQGFVHSQDEMELSHSALSCLVSVEVT